MLQNKDTFTSIELVDLINQYRQQEGNRKELQHYDFLKIVRDEFEEEIGVGNISESSYLNSQNKQQPMYILNHSESRQVLVRESKFVRKAVISYIDQLENKLANQLPKDYPSALRALADKAEETQRLMLENRAKDEQIAIQKPKVVFAEAVELSKNSVGVRVLSTILKQNGINIGQNRMFQWLRDNKYLSSRPGKSWNQPTQKALDLGLFELKPSTFFHNDGEPETNYTPLVTGKGQVYFINKFAEQLQKV